MVMMMMIFWVPARPGHLACCLWWFLGLRLPPDGKRTKARLDVIQAKALSGNEEPCAS